MTISKFTPDNVAPPIAQYNHVAVIPSQAELVVLSGQIGNDMDGFLPNDIESQFTNALVNIKSILQSQGIDPDQIFKINIWLTEQINREHYLAKWNEFFKESPPATTLAYVAALARPEIKVEIEAWAAR